MWPIWLYIFRLTKQISKLGIFIILTAELLRDYKMKKTKILICGASGFIGRNIFERLSNRKDIDLFGTYNTHRFCNNTRLIQADLTDRQTVNKLLRNIDVVIHAAAITSGS